MESNHPYPIRQRLIGEVHLTWTNICKLPSYLDENLKAAALTDELTPHIKEQFVFLLRNNTFR